MAESYLPARADARPSFFGQLNVPQIIATIVAALCISVFGGALSVWVTQARTTDRLEAVEEKQKQAVTRELLDERWKTVERIDQNVEKIRDALLERKVERR
jgi:hypothetical protein